MAITRRTFIKRGALAAAALVGPWSLAGRKGTAAATDTPALRFLTASEYRLINKTALTIVPDEPVLSGKVDVALNLDRFFADNPSPDFLVMLRYLRLVRLAKPIEPLLTRFVPATAEDLTSFKRMICFLGYYSDANGEADLPPEKRIVWPRLGYGGPKPEDWFPPDAELQLDPAMMVDRIKEGT